MPGFPCESRDHWQVRQTIKEERARADAEIEEYQEQPRLLDGCRLLFHVQGAEILRLDAQEQQGVSLFQKCTSRKT